LKKLVFIFIILTKLSFGQVISGIVIDSSTKKPIPYVGTGILHKGIGTVSDFNGNFKLDISGASKTDTIRFSSIGYASLDIPVSNLGKQTDKFKLVEQPQNIREVVIKPTVTKIKILGNTVHGGILCSGFNSSMLGTEMGTVLKYRKKNPGHIKNVNFNLWRNAYDSVLFKVNIYRMSDSGVKESILPHPIYLEPKIKSGTLTVDLSDSSLYITHDVLLSLELIRISKSQDKGNNKYMAYEKLLFHSSLLNGHSYLRKAAADNWELMPVDGSVGFWATVTYKK
jgi:hypothetical protein